MRPGRSPKIHRKLIFCEKGCAEECIVDDVCRERCFSRLFFSFSDDFLIFSFGFPVFLSRGLALDPFSGEIWEHEHGPMGGDEVNLIQPKKNYGWPVISYGVNYNGTKFTDITEKEGMEQPQIYWVPSIAPSGMDFVTSSKYGNLKGDLLVGSLKFGYLHRCVMKDNKIVEEKKMLEGIGRVRVVRQGPDGFVYLGVEGKGVLKLVMK